MEYTKNEKRRVDRLIACLERYDKVGNDCRIDLIFRIFGKILYKKYNSNK